MFAHVFEMTPGDINVVVWDSTKRRLKLSIGSLMNAST
jgi:hypothetical protein